jgi:hypothetical protein
MGAIATGIRAGSSRIGGRRVHYLPAHVVRHVPRPGREVPEAGLTFAHSMFLGVGLNLGAAQDVFPIER